MASLVLLGRSRFYIQTLQGKSAGYNAALGCAAAGKQARPANWTVRKRLGCRGIAIQAERETGVLADSIIKVTLAIAPEETD